MFCTRIEFSVLPYALQLVDYCVIVIGLQIVIDVVIVVYVVVFVAVVFVINVPLMFCNSNFPVAQSVRA